MKNGTESSARTILNRSGRDIGMSPFGGIDGPVPLSDHGEALTNMCPRVPASTFAHEFLKGRSDQCIT